MNRTTILILIRLLSITVAVGQLTTTLTHPDFSFERYPTLESIRANNTQPFRLSTSTPIYYSHVYGSLGSPVDGNITQIRYISSTDQPFYFQIWNMTDTSQPNLKGVIPVTPEAGSGDIKTLTEMTEIGAGDQIGVWVPYFYPIGNWKETGQIKPDFLIMSNFWADVRPENAVEPLESTSSFRHTRDNTAYIPAVEVTIQYDESIQTTPTTTTSTTTTPTTTTPTTTTPTTTTPTTTPTTTKSTGNLTSVVVNSTTTATLSSSTKKLTTESTSKLTKSTSEVTESSVPATNTTATAKQTGVVLSQEILSIIIGVAVAVVILCIVLVTAVLCVRKKQMRDLENVAELKRTYQMTAPHSDSGSDTIQDFEMRDSYRYPQPHSNTAFSSDMLDTKGIWAPPSNSQTTLPRGNRQGNGNGTSSELSTLPRPDYHTNQHESLQRPPKLHDYESYTPC